MFYDEKESIMYSILLIILNEIRDGNNYLIPIEHLFPKFFNIFCPKNYF